MGFRVLVVIVNGAPINGVANIFDTSIHAPNKIEFPITKKGPTFVCLSQAPFTTSLCFGEVEKHALSISRPWAFVALS